MSVSNSRQLYFLCKSVFLCSLLGTSNTVALLAKTGDVTRGVSHIKQPHTQFSCVTCNLLEKQVKSPASTLSPSRRIHAIARNKARKLRVTSLAGLRLSYLQFAGEFTSGVIADYPQLRVFLPEIASVFACKWMYFYLQKHATLQASHGQICLSSACKITCKKPL